MFSKQDEYWMQQAIQLAKDAEACNEVPVGAVLVLNEEMIGKGFNQPISLNDPTAHAEIRALRQAAQQLNNYRLPGTTLYVTLEPCMMCAGALVHARIQRLVFGACDLKSGVIRSTAKLLDQSFLNHRVLSADGLMADVCGQMLSRFFQARRGNS